MDERNYSLESTLKFKALKKPDTREGSFLQKSRNLPNSNQNSTKCEENIFALCHIHTKQIHSEAKKSE